MFIVLQAAKTRDARFFNFPSTNLAAIADIRGRKIAPWVKEYQQPEKYICWPVYIVRWGCTSRPQQRSTHLCYRQKGFSSYNLTFGNLPLFSPTLLTVFSTQGFLCVLHSSTLAFTGGGAWLCFPCELPGCRVSCSTLCFLAGLPVEEEDWSWLSDFLFRKLVGGGLIWLLGLLSLLVPQARHLGEPGLFSSVQMEQLHGVVDEVEDVLKRDEYRRELQESYFSFSTGQGSRRKTIKSNLTCFLLLSNVCIVSTGRATEGSNSR